MGLYQRNGIYYVRVQYCGKRLAKAVGPDRRQAYAVQKNWEKEIADAKAAGLPWAGLAKIQKAKSQPTFEAVANAYVENRIESSAIKPSTIRTYSDHLKSHLIPAFGSMKVAHITEDHVRKFQSNLAIPVKDKKRRPCSINNIWNLLNAILGDCEEQGLIAENPCHRVKRLREIPEDIDPLTSDELDLALKEIPPSHRVLFSVLAWTGMRPNEVLALRWEDIDWRKDQILVRKGRARGKMSQNGKVQFCESSPKTRGSSRTIVMHPDVKDALAQLRQAKVTNLDGYVFTNAHGEPLKSQLNVVWAKALRRAGIRHRPSYQLRHTWASTALESGESPGWVAKMLGHSNQATLFKHYARWIPDKQNGTRIGSVNWNRANA